MRADAGSFTMPTFPRALGRFASIGEPSQSCAHLRNAGMPASPMNDPVSIVSALEQPTAPLQFPLAEPPAPGTAIEVAPGVFWLRMPLPFALDHINLWLLRDGDGWTIVDCGLNTDATRELWEQLFGSLLADAPVRRVIVTHYHPDHFGLAGWLTRRFERRVVDDAKANSSPHTPFAPRWQATE